MAAQIQDVKQQAAGRWGEILQVIGGIDASYLTGMHQPCPKCGGNDRWRFTDFDDQGGAVCNKCGKFGDGVAVLEWFTGQTTFEVVESIAKHLGVSSAPKKKHTTSTKTTTKALTTKKDKTEPKWKKDIKWGNKSKKLIAIWCSRKTPIEAESLEKCNAKYGNYRGKDAIIGLPIIGESGEEVGFAIYNATGGTLEYYPRGIEHPPEFIKVKNCIDKGLTGWIGRLIAGDGLVVKTEGPTDALALLTIAPDDVSVICNPHGATETPRPWMVEKLAGRKVWTVHDCDASGQEGATYVENANRLRPGWSVVIATKASESKNVVLPYEISESRGKDLRDWTREQFELGKSKEQIWKEFLELGEAAELIDPPEIEEDEDREHVDDPHRLARINLDTYEKKHGKTLRYWKETWFSYSDGVYSEISTDHLIARINASVKEEFDRVWAVEKEKYDAWRKSDAYDEKADKGAPKVRKVKRDLVRDVLAATQGMCVLKQKQKIHDWITERQEGFCVSVKNGILNITNAITEGVPYDQVITPHTPNWFSTAKLHFDFNPNRSCERWVRFLDEVFSGDEEAIEVLQMWFGYLLTPDNSQNKIMFMIGEKRSGKGTIIHVMRELFGETNIATPTLTELSKDFSMAQFTEKMVAIIADARLSNRVDQSLITEKLLSISGGDPQNIQRKYKETLSAHQVKTRFTVFSNLVPKLQDISSAFISRCIFLHMPNSFYGREDFTLKDKLIEEMPGILNWAIVGRHKLNKAGRLYQPASGKGLLQEMTTLTSPLIDFIEECYEIVPKDVQFNSIDTREFYAHWEAWCKENDIEHPGSIQSVSRKLKAIKPSIEVQQYRKTMTERSRKFIGIVRKEDKCDMQF